MAQEIFDQNYTFSEYTSIVTPDNKNVIIPSNILNDINLLYSFHALDAISEEEFSVVGFPVIDNMIYNVAHTVIGTREFEPTFGSKCLIMIQEQCTQTNCEVLDIELFSAIKQWVPFCRLIFKSTYSYPVPDLNLIRAYINYVDIFYGLNRGFEMDFIK